jgi:hypothetical protein
MFGCRDAFIDIDTAIRDTVSLVMTHRLQSMAQAQFCSRGRLANISHS